MLDPDHVPAVSSDELLARFIIFSRHFRPSDNTVKADAFMPHPQVELSVTRHREAKEDELWQEGIRVAAIRFATLYGRADVKAETFEGEGLSVVARPIGTENPNHADVVNWPAEKPAQKLKAREIAIKSQFLPMPVLPPAPAPGAELAPAPISAHAQQAVNQIPESAVKRNCD